MTANELHLWLSARTEGSWSQFRSAVERLELSEEGGVSDNGGQLPAYQRIRFNLSRLGHVEFDAAECERGWRVVPPALAIMRDESISIGVLCGARSTNLLKTIQLQAHDLSPRKSAAADCPDVMTFSGDDAELASFADRAGIRSQLDAPITLLSNLPVISSRTGWLRTPMPVGGKGWEVKRLIFEKKRIVWQETTLEKSKREKEEGLFRLTLYQTPQYFLRVGRDTFKLPGAVGKFWALAQVGRRVLRYNKEHRTLSLPAICRPPLLVERSLVLCSGFPASLSVERKEATLTYQNVPETVAAVAAEVLKQDFQ